MRPPHCRAIAIALAAAAAAFVSIGSAGSARAETSCSRVWDPAQAKERYVCETRDLACPACSLGVMVTAMGTIPIGVAAGFEALGGGDPRRWKKGFLGTWATLGLIQVVSGVAMIAANADGDMAGGATWGSIGIAMGLPGAIVGTLGLLGTDRERQWPFEQLFSPQSRGGVLRPTIGFTAPGGGRGMTVGAAATF